MACCLLLMTWFIVCWSLSMSVFITGCLLLINWFRSVYYLWTSSSWLNVCTYGSETAIGCSCVCSLRLVAYLLHFGFVDPISERTSWNPLTFWFLSSCRVTLSVLDLSCLVTVYVLVSALAACNKPQNIVPKLSDKLLTFCNPRKEDTATYRLHISHSYFTHSFLLKKRRATCLCGM